MTFFRPAWQLVILSAFLLGQVAYAQSSSTSMTETVNQRNTVGTASVTPTSGLVTGSTATFSYTLHTAGAPAPTSETVQFYDGATALGLPQTIGSVSASNLMSYSQVDYAHGWTTAGTVPTSVTVNTGTGPDGGLNNATQIVYPNTTSSSSAVLFPMPGTAYANQAMTLSVWAKSALPTTLTLTLADNPAVTATQSSTCAVTSTWQRCILTYTFPANAGTGFSVALASANQPTQTISLWGVQVEQASVAGSYVSTIGTARPAGGQGGSVTYPYSLLQPGTHTISVQYAGDTSFVASTSNTLTVVVNDSMPPITLTASPASTSAYGTVLVFTATVMTPAGNPTDIPTGTMQFFDNTSTLIGTSTLSGGVATLALSGSNSLGGGTHSITAVYSGDTHFTSVTSSALGYTVSKAIGAVIVNASSSRNPSIYGDSVTFTLGVASVIGVTPTGSITVTDNGTTLLIVPLTGGNGMFTVPLFTVGTHPLTFTYSGDSNYN